MKLILSMLLFLQLFNGVEIGEIRKMYPTASVSENDIKEFQSKLSEVTMESNKTLIAYKGAAIAMMSKYIKKGTDKSKNFKEGVKWVEFAATSQPYNIEIRVIRLSIQENTPKVVNYNKNIKEDKNFILQHYKEESGSLKEYIKNFVLHSKSFSEAEKQSFK